MRAVFLYQDIEKEEEEPAVASSLRVPLTCAQNHALGGFIALRICSNASADVVARSARSRSSVSESASLSSVALVAAAVATGAALTDGRRDPAADKDMEELFELRLAMVKAADVWVASEAAAPLRRVGCAASSAGVGGCCAVACTGAGSGGRMRCS